MCFSSFSYNIFDFGRIFNYHTQRMERNNSISRYWTLCWIFWKKKSLKEIKYSRSLPDPENYRCGHKQPYNFFSVFSDFQTLPDNSGKPKSVDSKRKNQLQLGKFFLRLSQKKRFLEPIAKNPCIVNYWWTGINNYVYSIILVITKIYIFYLHYFTSVLLLIMRSQPASIAWQ